MNENPHLIDRHVYRINGRNLVFGVYKEATQQFIGLRESIQNRHKFLDIEFLRCNAHPAGTVTEVLRDLGVVVPEDIPLEIGYHDKLKGWVDNEFLHVFLDDAAPALDGAQ